MICLPHGAPLLDARDTGGETSQINWLSKLSGPQLAYLLFENPDDEIVRFLRACLAKMTGYGSGFLGRTESQFGELKQSFHWQRY
jgi:hypothetical protein